MCQWPPEGLGPLLHNSSSLLSNNSVMIGRGLGVVQAQEVVSLVDMAPRVEQELEEELIVLHCSM